MVKSLINHRINSKKQELEKKQEYFKIMVESEMWTSNFEQNAINDLIEIMKLKTEIKELEQVESVLSI